MHIGTILARYNELIRREAPRDWDTSDLVIDDGETGYSRIFLLRELDRDLGAIYVKGLDTSHVIKK